MLGMILITHESTRTFETLQYIIIRGGSRTAATSKMERFVITVDGWKPLLPSQSAPSWMLQQS